jgi:hypothetical protein
LETELQVAEAHQVLILKRVLQARHQSYLVDRSAVAASQVFHVNSGALSGDHRMAARDHASRVESGKVHLGGWRLAETAHFRGVVAQVEALSAHQRLQTPIGRRERRCGACRWCLRRGRRRRPAGGSGLARRWSGALGRLWSTLRLGGARRYRCRCGSRARSGGRRRGAITRGGWAIFR